MSEVVFLERVFLAIIFVQTGMIIEYRWNLFEKYVMTSYD